MPGRAHYDRALTARGGEATGGGEMIGVVGAHGRPSTGFWEKLSGIDVRGLDEKPALAKQKKSGGKPTEAVLSDTLDAALAWRRQPCDVAGELSALTRYRWRMTSDNQDAPIAAAAAPPARMQYHLIKSNYFRVIHADGIFGGVSLPGNITATFFNERIAIPQIMEHAILPNGMVGAEIARTGRTGTVRELETEVIMNLDTAKRFREWLDGRIAQLEIAMLQAAIIHAATATATSAGSTVDK